MCLHLCRANLKGFLVTQAKMEQESEDGPESIHDSILGKWTAIAKKAKTIYPSVQACLFPKMIDEYFNTIFQEEKEASNEQIKDLIGMVSLFTSILRATDSR